MYASLIQFALYGMYTLKRFNSQRFDDKLETIMFPRLESHNFAAEVLPLAVRNLLARDQ